MHSFTWEAIIFRFSGPAALQRHHGGDLWLALPGPEAGLQCGGRRQEVGPGGGGGGGDDEREAGPH